MVLSGIGRQERGALGRNIPISTALDVTYDLVYRLAQSGACAKISREPCKIAIVRWKVRSACREKFRR